MIPIGDRGAQNLIIRKSNLTNILQTGCSCELDLVEDVRGRVDQN